MLKGGGKGTKNEADTKNLRLSSEGGAGREGVKIGRGGGSLEKKSSKFR